MQSLRNIAIVKTAVTISFYPELKQEILCGPRSEFKATKSRHKDCRKEQWNAIIEKKAREILKRQGLPNVLADEVLKLLPAIGLKMLIWAEYHEGTLGFTRGFSLNFLRYSHITREGFVDNVKAAEDLMEYGRLRLTQLYKLACMYCFVDDIDSLYKDIAKDVGKDAFTIASNMKWFQTPDIVKFWTSQKTGKMETFPNISPSILRMRQAIKSGIMAAVTYSWNKIDFGSQEVVLFDAATEILTASRSTDADWIVFSDLRFDDVKDAWVPTDYSDDILRFIFLKMLELQQQGVLQTDVLNHFHPRCVYLLHLTSVLELFLGWPHQEYFMKTAAIMWEFMPEKMYAALLLKICDRIEPLKDNNLQYGEEKSYDYRYMLKEFWRESPDHYKRYVFQNVDFEFNDPFEETTPGKRLLLRLLSLKKFTLEDEGIVRSILDCATDGEREYLFLATCWKNTIVDLMKAEKFETFDRLLRVCFRSELKAGMFKENLNLHAEARNICKMFLKYKKLNAIKSFLNRISVTEYQLECLKLDLIYSPEGKIKCLEILSYDGNKAFERFLRWFLPTEASARAFRRALTVEQSCDVPHLQPDILYELTDQHAKCDEATDGSVSHLRECIVDVFGLQICEELICSHSLQAASNDGCSSLYAKSNFRGGQWEKLGQFLSLLPAGKILAFKKTVREKSGIKILTKLVGAKLWSETERFLRWLELSKDEIRHLKWKALTTTGGTWSLFHYLVFSDSDCEAKKVEEVYAMLKWHLTDRNSVLGFRRFFLRCHRGYEEAGLNVFTSVVDMYLDELDRERFAAKNARMGMTQNEGVRSEGVETQSPAPAAPKKTRLSQPGVKEKQKKAGPKKARLSQPGVKEKQKKKVTVVAKRRRSQRLLDKANKK